MSLSCKECEEIENADDDAKCKKSDGEVCVVGVDFEV